MQKIWEEYKVRQTLDNTLETPVGGTGQQYFQHEVNHLSVDLKKIQWLLHIWTLKWIMLDWFTPAGSNLNPSHIEYNERREKAKTGWKVNPECFFLAQTQKIKNIWLNWRDIERNVKRKNEVTKNVSAFKKVSQWRFIFDKTENCWNSTWNLTGNINNAMALLDIFTLEYLSKSQ